MSYSIMKRVQDSNLPRVEKTVLLAVASFVEDDGRGYYASEARIVYKTDYDLSYVEKALKRLRAQGILLYNHKHPRYGVDVWDINLARIEPQALFDEWYKAEWPKIRQKRSGHPSRCTGQDATGQIQGDNGASQGDLRADFHLHTAHISHAAGNYARVPASELAPAWAGSHANGHASVLCENCARAAGNSAPNVGNEARAGGNDAPNNKSLVDVKKSISFATFDDDADHDDALCRLVEYRATK